LRGEGRDDRAASAREDRNDRRFLAHETTPNPSVSLLPTAPAPMHHHRQRRSRSRRRCPPERKVVLCLSLRHSFLPCSRWCPFVSPPSRGGLPDRTSAPRPAASAWKLLAAAASRLASAGASAGTGAAPFFPSCPSRCPCPRTRRGCRPRR